MKELKSLLVQERESVAEVTLIGPGKGNAMGPDFWREMPVVFEALDQNPAIRAVVVRGKGEHLSYGLDLMAMVGEMSAAFGGQNLAKERLELHDLILRMQHAISVVARCRKPVIAAIHGWCIGGGLDLISACDIRLCTAGARFSLRETRMAIVADLGSLQRLAPIIGQGNLRELALTGKDIDAQRALQMGLVNQILDDEAALFAAAEAMAQQIAANSPLAVQGAKRVLNHLNERAINEGLAYVATWNSAFLQSQDLGEAFAAFAQRRAGFKGE